ncbi:hypothetical protein KUCAC02_000107 [Chaenocephalus aceratus]|nr:hypothetical protein KUCAC02_000107 [Chaenocephalus aceratus]
MSAKRKPSSQSSPLHRKLPEPEHVCRSEPSVERCSPALSSTSPKKSQGKAKGKATGSKTSAKPKRRRQKKQTWIQSTSMFSPREPEIKLNWAGPVCRASTSTLWSAACAGGGQRHGPGGPPRALLSRKVPAQHQSNSRVSDVKQEAGSDSDSSCCDIRVRGGKRAVPSKPRPLRPGAKLKQKGLLESQRWAADGHGSPAAKRARADPGSAADVEDWYSPPVLPMELCEYWLHEGLRHLGRQACVLVKGRVYGLEEAVKMCSACSEPGATLGCFFKGCPNKYHYRCALQSDGELMEENLSMKCKKHKNKRLKAPPGNRRDDR